VAQKKILLVSIPTDLNAEKTKTILHNMNKIIAVIMISSFMIACAQKSGNSLAENYDYTSSDQTLINLLIKNGSDPQKIHAVEFMVDCSSKPVVTDITQKAVELGFEEDAVTYSQKLQTWSVGLIIDIPLNIKNVSDYRAKLTPIVPLGVCRMVTWGASVVK
jgi:hypothetical protein